MPMPWFLLVGALLIVIALTTQVVQKLPLSAANIYLAVGVAIGPLGLALVELTPMRHAALLSGLCEIAVLITLFAVGLRLRVPFKYAYWRVPLLLASVGMALTIVLTAVAAHWLLALGWPAALLLGAILAPTDPVLAADVQIRTPDDRDTVRLSLTSEGGLNDGAALPAVLLALGLLGLHPLGEAGWHWLVFDVVWAVAGGIGLGVLCGLAVAATVRRLRQAGHLLQFEEFLVLGVIALTYGAALAIQVAGFLAVFAAALTLVRIERKQPLQAVELSPAQLEAMPGGDPNIRLSQRLLDFSEQCERLAEVAIVILIGALLFSVRWDWAVVVLALVLLVAIRPLMVLCLWPGSRLPASQRRLIAWFGIRGVGSVYYLGFVLGHDLPAGLAATLSSATLVAIAFSIVSHGISATPLMARYHHRNHQGSGGR